MPRLPSPSPRRWIDLKRSSGPSTRRTHEPGRRSSPRSDSGRRSGPASRRCWPSGPTSGPGFRGRAGAVFNRLQRFWTSIKIGIDLVMLAIAFGLAYLTRFDAFSAPRPPLRESLVTLALALVVFPVAYRQSRLYATNRIRTHLGEVFELFKATITGGLVLVALTYFTRERYSRLTLVFFAGYSFLLVATTRVAFRMWLESMRRKGLNLKSILLVGAGELG